MRYYEVTAKCGHVGKKDKRGFLVFIGSVWYNHLKKTQTAERLNRKEETHGS